MRKRQAPPPTTKLRPSPTRIKPTERVVVPPMNMSPERLAKALFRIKPGPGPDPSKRV